MTYTHDMSDRRTNGGSEKEYRVGTPDLEGHLVLRQLARARGLHTHEPDGAQNLVVVRGRESRVRALIKEAESLAQRLYGWRFQTLGRFLKDHGLEWPPPLARALALLEAEADAASDRNQAEEAPSKRG